MMKGRILLITSALMFLSHSVCNALPVSPGYRIHRHLSHRKVIPWKPIVAGGAAAGTVIAAYKVSNGVETGLETAANAEPALFLQTFSLTALFMRLLLWAIFIIAAYLFCKYVKNKIQQQDKYK